MRATNAEQAFSVRRPGGRFIVAGNIRQATGFAGGSVPFTDLNDVYLCVTAVAEGRSLAIGDVADDPRIVALLFALCVTLRRVARCQFILFIRRPVSLVFAFALFLVAGRKKGDTPPVRRPHRLADTTGHVGQLTRLPARRRDRQEIELGAAVAR